jgi:hypothetical protein
MMASPARGVEEESLIKSCGARWFGGLGKRCSGRCIRVRSDEKIYRGRNMKREVLYRSGEIHARYHPRGVCSVPELADEAAQTFHSLLRLL